MDSSSGVPDKSNSPVWARGWLSAPVASLLVSLLIVVPFFWRGVASGHDFEFHATSWLEAASQFKEGIAYPRWAEWANHGFGEPRFIFYPPLSWMLGAALSFLVRWDYVPVLFIVLVQTFAGWSAFVFARRLVCGRVAVFAAIFYAANPNALLMIYFRSDYAELLASAFYPLVFLYALQWSGILEPEKRRGARALALFAATFAAVWLSNAPAGVMVTYSVTLLFVWAGAADESSKPIARWAAALALGFGIAGAYLVPAAYEQRWVNIAQALAPGLTPSENFLYSEGSDPEHTFFNYIASTLAILVIVLAGFAVLAAHRRNAFAADKARGEAVCRTFLLIAAVSTALMLRPANFLWQVLPKLRFVQFPWRWMSIMTIPLTYFLCVAARGGRFRWIWMLMAGAILAGTGVFLVQETWWDDEEFPTLTAAFDHGEGFDGTDEYDPINDDHYNLPQKAPAAVILSDSSEAKSSDAAAQPPARVLVYAWTPEFKEVRVSAAKPVRLALRLVNYPAWHVEVNGAGVVPESADDTGQMVVEVPAGDSRVTLRFTRTRDRAIGGGFTLVSLVILGLLFVRERRPRALPLR
jgi:hypothetical protein